MLQQWFHLITKKACSFDPGVIYCSLITLLKKKKMITVLFIAFFLYKHRLRVFSRCASFCPERPAYCCTGSIALLITHVRTCRLRRPPPVNIYEEAITLGVAVSDNGIASHVRVCPISFPIRLPPSAPLSINTFC